MRVLLIFYLTNRLKYSDNHTYGLFSAYCSLAYITPILGGFLADKILGDHIAVMLGALLTAIDHVASGVSGIHPSFPYLSSVIIVCGYGLFKSNISCLLGELYEPTGPRRDGSFSPIYTVGSMGPIVASIVCGFVQEEYSWAMGFGLTAVGIIAGLVIFLCGNRHFTYTHGVNKKVLCATNLLLPNWGWLLVLPVATPALITVLLWKEWSVYALIVATIIGLGVLAKTYRKVENRRQRKELGLIVTFIFFNMLSQTFTQQGGSSISLYTDHPVDRDMFGHTVPTAVFQLVNVLTVMLCGMFLMWVVKESVAGNRTMHIWGEFAFSLDLMSVGLCTLALSAHWSTMYGHSSLPLMVLDLATMGFTELFIDSVAVSQITYIEIPGVTGVSTDVCMLLSGVIANYLAGVVADQTSQASFGTPGVINYSVSAYIEVFGQITWGALACVGLVLMIWLYQTFKLRSHALTLES